MKSPIALLGGLYEDIKRLNPDVEGLDRDIITIQQRYENEGYGFLTVSLQALGDALVRGLSTGLFACPTGFKKVRKGAIPRVFSGLLCKVFESSTGKLREDADIGVIKALYGAIRLMKKTQLSPENEALLHKKAVNGFFQDDEAARTVVIPDRHAHHLGRVSKLLLNSLNEKEAKDAIYRHGPGGVEEGYTANQKWKAVSSELTSGSLDGTDFGLEVQAQHHITWLHKNRSDSGRHVYPKLRPLRAVELVGDVHGHRSTNLVPVSLFGQRPRGATARLISVLKNSTSRRTITVEPVLKQFIQQGLKTQLRQAIEECRILSASIAITDQSKNQVLALEGSLSDNWATIDLKSASDLLSVKLVEIVFGHHGQFFDHMMDCRSSSVYSDLTEAKDLGKFAGMGNALTFPVQSVCFAAVSIAAILDTWGKSPSYWACRRASRHVRVYGDDIIISTEYAHQVVDWLQQVGLKVNLKKSFLKGNFKESCGVDGFKGVDITPLYLKHRPDDNSTDPSVIAGLVSLSNHMWLEGLYKASTILANEVERRLGKRLPLVSRESGSLGWWSRVDSSHVHKWCKRRHQFLVRASGLSPVKRKDIIDGYAALLKYFCTSERRVEDKPSLATRLGHLFPDNGNESDHLSRTPIRFKSRITSSWVPVRLMAYR